MIILTPSIKSVFYIKLYCYEKTDLLNNDFQHVDL
jgi:hypothetical protein